MTGVLKNKLFFTDLRVAYCIGNVLKEGLNLLKEKGWCIQGQLFQHQHLQDLKGIFQSETTGH